MLLDISNNLHDDRKQQLNIVKNEGLEIQIPSSWVNFTNNNRPKNINELLDFYDIQQVEVPIFDLEPIEQVINCAEHKEFADFDESVFAEWKIYDVPVMLAAGAAGAGLSYFLADKFEAMHDEKWAKTPATNGGHSGEIVDRVPGSSGPGQFGHRWKYGHDILNPFEINVDEYFQGPGSNIPSLPASGLPRGAKILYYWIRHLIQDTFSREGLPLPGSSYIRDWLEPLIKSPKGRQILQTLGTIKARDLAGAGLTNILMGAYIWGTEKSLSRLTVKANYRAFSLMAGANLTTILIGLTLPPPYTTFNYSCLPPMLYYGGRLIWMAHKIDKALKIRHEKIELNSNIMHDNRNILAENEKLLNYRQKQIEHNEKIIYSFKKSSETMHEHLALELGNDSYWPEQFKKWSNIDNENDLIDAVVYECMKLTKEQ